MPDPVDPDGDGDDDVRPEPNDQHGPLTAEKAEPFIQKQIG